MPVRIPLHSSAPFFGFTPSVILNLAHSLLPRFNQLVLYLGTGHASGNSCKHYFNYLTGNINLLYYLVCSLGIHFIYVLYR